MSQLPTAYGVNTRGVTAADVELAADALFRAGEKPTIAKVRAKIGTGSPNTINPLLDAWWKTAWARLDSGPAAFHRLPESVAHVAEALWMQALEEGRRRAHIELTSSERAAANQRQDLEIRSHVLTLREGELDSRLRDRERSQAALEAQLRELTLLLRKEQASRETQAQRIVSLEEQLLSLTQRRGRASRPTALPTPTGKRNTTRAAKPSGGSKLLRRKPATKRKRRR